MIGLTIWRSEDFAKAIAESEALLQAVQPGVVNLHLWPQDSTQKFVDRVRKVCPTAELWVSPGVNTLADDSVSSVEKQGKAWGKAAVKLGARVLLLNAEGPAAEGHPGWTSKDKAQRAQLAERVKALLSSCAESGITLGLTSHDCPDWHHLTWQAWLGADSPVKIHAPQVYPGIPRPGATLKGCRKRWATATAQWDRQVKRGIVRHDLGPQGSGWCTYTQGWGAEVAGTCWLLDQRDRGLVWASPSRLWAEGRAALAASCEVRRQAGDSAGAIARYQASKGLTADGVVGPRTLSALGAIQ